MPDGLIVIGVAIGLGLVVLGGAALGPSGSSPLVGLFGDRHGRDWPTGVQEGDVPHFRLPPEPRAAPDSRTPTTSATRARLRPVVRRREHRD